jgi:hypothetical protein
MPCIFSFMALKYRNLQLQIAVLVRVHVRLTDHVEAVVTFTASPASGTSPCFIRMPGTLRRQHRYLRMRDDKAFMIGKELSVSALSMAAAGFRIKMKTAPRRAR